MMNTEFQKYLMNALNEADDDVEKLSIKKVFKLDPPDPSKLDEDDTGKITGIIDNKNYKKLLKQFQKGKNGWWIKPDGEHAYYVTDKDLKKELEELNKEKTKNNKNTTDAKEYNTEKFKLMGKTLAYRSALGCAQYGDNFQKLARDVLTDDSEYSISQLYNIKDLFNLAAAIKTVNGIKNREQKNQNIVSKCNEALTDLENEGTRADTIKTIKKDYEKDFKNNYNLFEQAYQDGIKEQQKEMSKPDFEWKDPATGVKPTGFGKLNKWVGKGLANLGAVADKIANKIPNEHNLENDMARLAVFGVKGMMLAAKGITKLFQTLGSGINLGRASFRKDNSKKKFEDVKKKGDSFIKDFNNWFKNKNKDNQNESYQLNEANDTKERDKILKKFDDLMYSEILPYYYYKLSIIVDSFENNDDKYILKETDEGWNTLNASNGKTLIEDNSDLMKKIVNYINKDLKTALEEFKDESTKNIFRAIPKDIQYNNKIETNFKNWCDNLKTETNIIDFIKVYNKEIIIQKFNKYIEVLNYFKNTSSKLEELKGITPLKDTKLEFKEPNKKIIVPGIIVKKESIDDEDNENEDEDENNSIENADELKKQFDAISQELEKLKEINGDSAKLDKIDELSKKLEEIDGKIQTTYDELWKIVQTKNNKDEFKQYEIDKDKTPVFQKIINVKAIMAKLGINESIVINEIKQLLLEETENKELDNAKKELKDLLDKKFEDSDLKKYDEIKSNIEKIEGVPEEIKEKPELVLALGDKESEGNKEDESKIDTYVKETKAIIDGINIENISKEDFYNKLKTAFDKTEDGILEWCKNDEKRLELYTRHELPGEIKDDIIPKLWNAKYFLSTVYKEIKQESFNPFYDYDFIMLLEAEDEQNTEGDGKEGESKEDKKKNLEEISNKVKNGCEAINKLLVIEKENDFVSQYKEWKNGATELFNQFGDKIENKDQMKDPIQMMTGMCIALKKANEGGEKPAEGGEKQEGNQETGQEGGQESNKEGENNQEG